MATITASAAQANIPAKFSVNRDTTRVVKFSIGAFGTAMSAGDVVQMMKVPAGAVVSRVVTAISDHPGVLTVNVGDGNDVSAYGASVVLSGSAVAAASLPVRGLGRSYSAEDTIDIRIAAISAASATGSLKLSVTYNMDN